MPTNELIVFIGANVKCAKIKGFPRSRVKVTEGGTEAY